MARMREALDRGDVFQDEVLNYWKDGTPFWNLVRFSPVRDAAGTLTHYVGILTDVTEQRRDEEERKMAA